MLEEKEFTQSQKFEMEERLAKVRGYLNSIVSDMPSDFFPLKEEGKKSTKVTSVYYAGGTLCIDVQLADQHGLILLNISDETVTLIFGDSQKRFLMSLPVLWFSFTIYKGVKGFHLEYYQKCYENSCIRHQYNMLMEKHGHDMISDLQSAVFEHASKLDYRKMADEILGL